MPPCVWVRAYFVDHPDAVVKGQSAFTNPKKPDKVKGYCKNCLSRDLAALRGAEEQEVSQNLRHALSP